MRRKKVGLALSGGSARGLAHIGFHDFYHAHECILQGEIATHAVIPEIRERLKLKRKSK